MYKVYKTAYSGLRYHIATFNSLGEAKKFVESYKNTEFYEGLIIDY